MPFLPSLKPDATVSDLYRGNRRVYLHWIRMGHEVMTEDGPLSQGERELVAVYVSSLNDCDYCRTSHLPAMALHGIEQEVVDALLDDIETAPVEETFKPLFRFVRKLAVEPAALTRADAEAVFAAGWSEDALQSAILVTCRFSFMNRLVMGHGLTPPDEATAKADAKRRMEQGYAHLAAHMPGGQSSDAAQ
ncbi:MAG TPA: peroxidase-related enzyme [Hyphomicrobiales bacterium]|nr:peroxidase-related enzyme [Hyphomicrobiales bacterium]